MHIAAEKPDLRWGNRLEDWADLAVYAGAGLMVIGVIIFGWQLFSWLQSAQWPSLSGWELLQAMSLPGPAFSWPEAQKIAVRLLNLPLALDFFMLGAFLARASELKSSQEKS